MADLELDLDALDEGVHEGDDVFSDCEVVELYEILQETEVELDLDLNIAIVEN